MVSEIIMSIDAGSFMLGSSFGLTLFVIIFILVNKFKLFSDCEVGE